MVRAKGNYSKVPRAFEFGIAEEVIVTRQVPEGLTTTKLIDVSETDVTEAEILDGSDHRERKSQAALCEQRLRKLLAGGEWHHATEITDVLEAEDYATTTIHRATVVVGVEREKEKRRSGKMMWRLPTTARVKWPA